ncbi:hypothetical protein MSC49_24640 [Methylosinus sp. C49]|uniref:hypothetical protein n=1 Tax=Methylosinus sp. C49 TaxID=2699395 RepID=UPI001366923F|nr:hypothetical protein [Methylosinus sp. C49]BBU62529.1 hypothetical protein MSC49_24640 [Methylosinus sp. C49]
MSQNRQPHILTAASNLLGICFVLITGLKISKVSDSTLLDEVAMVSAVGFVGACLFSFVSLLQLRAPLNYELIADILFVVAMLCLLAAVLMFGRSLL